MFSVALIEKEKANGNEGVDNDADKYFEPMEAACLTKQPRLMEIGLDALHFLIGHLCLCFYCCIFRLLSLV